MNKPLSLLVITSEARSAASDKVAGMFASSEEIKPLHSHTDEEPFKSKVRNLRNWGQRDHAELLHVFVVPDNAMVELMSSSLPQLDIDRKLRVYQACNEYDRVALYNGADFRVVKNRGEADEWSAFNNVTVADREHLVPGRGGPVDIPVMGPDVTPEVVISTIEKYIAELPGRTMLDVLTDVEVVEGANELDLIIKFTTNDKELAERLKALGMTVDA